MILLQDQFDDIIGKSDLDNLNQISIYHNSKSRNSNKYYDDSNKCYDITKKGYIIKPIVADCIIKDIFLASKHTFLL